MKSTAPKKPLPSAPAATEQSAGSRDEILKAALTCFSESGFEGTSIADIARTAGVRHPLVHYHFKSKDLLWKATAEFAFKDLMMLYQAVGMASADLEPIDALKVMIRVFVKFCGQYPEHVGLLLGEGKIESDRFDWIIETYLKPLHANFDRLIALAVANGQIRDIPLVHLSNMMIGAAVQFVSTRAMIRKLYDVDALEPQHIADHANAMVDVFLNGILTKI